MPGMSGKPLTVAEAGDRCGWPGPPPTLTLILILSPTLSLTRTERAPTAPADPPRREFLRRRAG